MSELEKWIIENKRGAYNLEGIYQGFTVPEHAVRALFRGKVLAPTISIQFAIECIKYARGEIEASGMTNEEGRRVLLNLHDTHLELLHHALHPTSEGKP